MTIVHFDESRSNRRVYPRNSLGRSESWSSRMCHRRRHRSAYIASPRLPRWHSRSPHAAARTQDPFRESREKEREREKEGTSWPGRRTVSSAPTLAWTPERWTDLLRNHAYGPRGQRGTFCHLSSSSMRVFSGEWMQDAVMCTHTQTHFGESDATVSLCQMPVINSDQRRVFLAGLYPHPPFRIYPHEDSFWR